MLTYTICTGVSDYTLEGEFLRLSSTLRNGILLPAEVESGLIDNRRAIHKYYPKKIISAFVEDRKFPNCLNTNVKGLNKLKTKTLKNTKGLGHSLNSLEIFREDHNPKITNIEFKKMIIASKFLDHLKVRGALTNKMLTGIRYFQNLRSLKINVRDDQLSILSKIILNIHTLERLGVILVGKSRRCLDPTNFISFCETTLTRRGLKVFNLDFDSNKGHYSTDAFEKVFELLYQSNIEQWFIQMMLFHDRVLEIAEKSRAFKEVEQLIIHPSTIISSGYNRGLTCSYISHDDYPVKSKLLNIYLMPIFKRETEHVFELEALLKQCPRLECLDFKWEYDPLIYNQSLSHFDDFQANFLSLKTLLLDFGRGYIDLWEAMIRILDHTPFLEVFRLYNQDYASQSEPMTKLSVINQVANKLLQISTLHSVDFKIYGLSQEALNIVQSLFDSLKGLKTLKFSTKFFKGFTFILPKNVINNLSYLKELWLSIPYEMQTLLEDLTNAIRLSDSSELQVLVLSNQGPGSIRWQSVQELMRILPKLKKLRKFDLSSDMIFDSDTVKGTEDRKTLMKIELMELIANCPTLEEAKIANVNSVEIEYSKYPKPSHLW